MNLPVIVPLAAAKVTTGVVLRLAIKPVERSVRVTV